MLRRVFLCAALLLTAAPAFAQQSNCTPRGAMGFLTPEQRLMHFADMQKATAGQPRDQMRDYRKKERDKVLAMNEAQRQQYAADLSKRWAALSPDQQKKVKDDALALRGQMGGRGMGGGGRGANCS